MAADRGGLAGGAGPGRRGDGSLRARHRGARRARIPAEPGFLGLDRATLETTFRVANRIRARYTVLDFLEGQDRLGEAVEAALA